MSEVSGVSEQPESGRWAGWPRALQDDLQRRRLFLAAVAVVLPGGDRAPSSRDARAHDPAGLRSGGVLGLAEFSDAEGRERLRLCLAGDASTPRVRGLAEPTRFAALCATAERLAKGWWDHGVRILSAPEICDERNCVRSLADRTPQVVWAVGAVMSGQLLAAADFWAARRVALIHSRKGRVLHSGLPWVRATAAVAATLAAGGAGLNAEGPVRFVGIGGGGELPAQVARAALVAQRMPVVDVLTAPLEPARVAWISIERGVGARGRGERERAGARRAGPNDAIDAADAAARADAAVGITPAALTLSAVWPDEAVRSTGATHAARGMRRDDLVLAVAHSAVVVTLRAGGNWHTRLAAAAADAGAGAAQRRRIAVVDPLQWGLAEQGGAALIAAGCAVFQAGAAGAAGDAGAEMAAPVQGADAAGWVAERAAVSAGWVAERAAVSAARVGEPDAAGAAGGSVLAGGPEPGADAAWPWLTHWTRRASGAWPDEHQEAWLARVLCGAVPETSSAQGALAVLARIVSMRRVIGGRLFLRHGPAVCLTQWPPEQLATLARRHRGLNRPLYEPFGIGFRREYLIGKGATPVVYGDDAVWSALAPTERFRFQFEGDAAEPWSVEGEWRVAGDLDFSDAGAEDVCVFVPTASAVAAVTRWGFRAALLGKLPAGR